MYSVYQVVSGDTIDNIASRVGVSANELMSLNGINNISLGQLLVVPNNMNIFDHYTVKSGDNMYEIARRYNINLDDLFAINGLDKDDYIYPNQTLLVPKNDTLVYVTVENDTISNVADKLGISQTELLRQNEIYLLPEQMIIYKRS